MSVCLSLPSFPRSRDWSLVLPLCSWWNWHPDTKLHSPPGVRSSQTSPIGWARGGRRAWVYVAIEFIPGLCSHFCSRLSRYPVSWGAELEAAFVACLSTHAHWFVSSLLCHRTTVLLWPVGTSFLVFGRQRSRSSVSLLYLTQLLQVSDSVPCTLPCPCEQPIVTSFRTGNKCKPPQTAVRACLRWLHFMSQSYNGQPSALCLCPARRSPWCSLTCPQWPLPPVPRPLSLPTTAPNTFNARRVRPPHGEGLNPTGPRRVSSAPELPQADTSGLKCSINCIDCNQIIF